MSNLVSDGIKEIRCQTGYFTFEGASLLLPALKQCANNDTITRFVIGSNRGTTVANHVSLLFDSLEIPRSNASLGIMNYDTSLFHPKVYHFTLNDNTQTAYVGSANLTGPGVSGLNLEAGILLDTREGDAVILLEQISKSVDDWFGTSVEGIKIVKKPSDVEHLLSKGFLCSRKEAQLVDPSVEGGRSTPGQKARSGVKLTPLFKMKWRGEAANLVSGERIRLIDVPEVTAKNFKIKTEASYHYPQGTHLGHFVTLMHSFEQGRSGTPYDDKFVRMSGNLDSGRLGNYQRQVKYKLAAAMELGLITDLRLSQNPETFILKMTKEGKSFWNTLKPYVNISDLEVGLDGEGVYSSRLPKSPEYYTSVLRDALSRSKKLRILYDKLFMRMPAVIQMIHFLYFSFDKAIVSKDEIYQSFFKFRPVVEFCNVMGIPVAADSAAQRRCPFLLSLLDARGILSVNEHSVTVEKFAVSAPLLAMDVDDLDNAQQIVDILVSEWDIGAPSLSDKDRKALKEAYGSEFLTERYHLKQIVQIEN
nr:phospholipase D family protein [Brucella anthropi]